MDKPLMAITEAAKIIGTSVTTLASGLQQGLYPFGNATKGKAGSYRYLIIRKRFEKYLSGEDMNEYLDHTIDSLENCETLISVTEAAKFIGIAPTTLEWGLQQNLYPFGNATRNNTGTRYGHHWRYIIFKRRFELFLSAGDMKAPEGWQQINHFAVLTSNTDPSYLPRIVCARELKHSEIDGAYFENQIRMLHEYDKHQKELEEINKYLKLSDEKKLRIYCETSGIYYSSNDSFEILGYGIDFSYCCKKGHFKGINPDGRKWFIKIEDFDNMNPSWMPKSCQKRFKKYLSDKYGIDSSLLKSGKTSIKTHKE